MATEIPVLDMTFTAAADLSASQYCFVFVDSAGKAALPTAAGMQVIGVLQNKPTIGQAATVRVYGVSKVVAGGVVAPGDRIATLITSGKAKTASKLVQASGAASYATGIALNTANTATNDVFTAFIGPVGTDPTAYA